MMEDYQDQDQNEANDDRKKIVVDSDWKEQVQAEKEAAQRSAEGQVQQPPEPQLPPPTFGLLVSSLATQSLMALGQIPTPDGKVEADLNHAKHAIDMLGMLEEKTKGNLDREEAEMLDQVLHELRMAYVAISKNPNLATDPGQDLGPTPGS